MAQPVPVRRLQDPLSRAPERATNGGPPPFHSQNSTHPCSICLEEHQYPVVTNCGHVFCAQCILTHWNHERYPQPCHCPMCRREVTILLSSEDWPTRNRELYSQVSAYNQRMCDSQGGLVSRLRDLPVLLQHLGRDFFSVGRGLPICSKLYIVLLAFVLFIYVCSPLDLIPEAIFGIFGLVDDLIAVMYMLLYAAGIYRTFVANLDR